jgi:hypothetical protein
MRNPICLFREIWRTLWAMHWTSGHEFRTSDEPTPDNVHVLECKTCGATSTSWSWTSLKQFK